MPKQEHETPPDVPGQLTPASYDATEARMFWSSPMYAEDASILGELSRARAKGADAYLFTAYSAVPLADFVRGFYSALGDEIPLISYIMARKVHRGDEHRAQLMAEEIPRLGKVLAGRRRVCVVEQYVGTHETLFFAHGIVTQATGGAAEQDDIRGQYYHLVDPSDIDLENVTSVHKTFMRSLGQRAALSCINDSDPSFR